jgi:rhodanese-related sulfurtransferase
MSWNAAKRAREEYGYTRVFWYPFGTDGWGFQDYPLEKVTRAE